MDTPDRDDDPVDSWEYRDHQCHVYTAEAGAPAGDDEAVWAGYARSKLPDGLDDRDEELHAPGTVTRDDDGWVGFTVSADERDADRTRADVEDLVDQLVELEASMDG